MNHIFCNLNITDGYIDTNKLLLYSKMFSTSNSAAPIIPPPRAGEAIAGLTKLIYYEEEEQEPMDE